VLRHVVPGVYELVALPLKLAEAKALVPHAAFVGCFGRAGEPALVDAAAVRAVGVPVVGMQPDPLAGVQERPRHPRGRQTQPPLADVERPIQYLGDGVVFS
jgi:hypothetical protein